jgi:hypothetical protein
MSVSRVRENRMHGSMRRREATTTSRASTRRAAADASRRPYNWSRSMFTAASSWSVTLIPFS